MLEKIAEKSSNGLNKKQNPGSPHGYRKVILMLILMYPKYNSQRRTTYSPEPISQVMNTKLDGVNSKKGLILKTKAEKTTTATIGCRLV